MSSSGHTDPLESQRNRAYATDCKRPLVQRKKVYKHIVQPTRQKQITARQQARMPSSHQKDPNPDKPIYA